jgi:hypothetical protein
LPSIVLNCVDMFALAIRLALSDEISPPPV